MAYRLVAWFLRLVSRVFFRQIEVVGLEHVPRDGAVIFAGNHPNSLIDPILIITTCGRKVHFAAKDTLFRTFIMRKLLGALGAVPLARRDDHGAGGKLDNDAAFTHMFATLGDGGAIGIFPEGLSHDESELAKLKTGAARLALGASARTPRPIAIVPCGLTFIHPKRFRSRVLVQYGAPIVLTAEAPLAAPVAPDKARVAELTAQIETHLRRLTINAPSWESVRTLDVVRRLYQPQEISIEQRVELSRRFNTHYPSVADRPEVVALMARVTVYREKLEELGVSDRELARDHSRLEVAGRMLRHLGLVAFWTPLTVPGAPLHLPTVLFARVAGKRLTPRKDVIATTKLLIGLGLALLSYVIVIGLLAWKVSLGWAIAATVVLPLSGWATLVVLDRLRLVRRAFSVLLRQLRFEREVRTLRADRERLSRDVIDLVGQIAPTGLALMFPPSHPARGETTESDDARADADLDAEFDADAADSMNRRGEP